MLPNLWCCAKLVFLLHCEVLRFCFELERCCIWEWNFTQRNDLGSAVSFRLAVVWQRTYFRGQSVFELTTQGDFSPKIPSGKYDQTYIKRNENSILDIHVKQNSSGGWLSTWRLIIYIYKKKLHKTVKLILDYSKGAKLSISIPSQSLEGEASEGSFQDFLWFIKRSSKPFFFFFSEQLLHVPFGILFMTVETGTVSFWLRCAIKAHPRALITF